MNLQTILKYAIGPFGVSLLSFAIVPVLAWGYSDAVISSYAMLQAIMAFSILVFTFGFDQAFVREYYEYENKAELLKTTLTGIFFPLSFFCLIGLVFYKSITNFLFSTDSLIFSLLLLISLMLVVLNRLLSLIQRMENQALLYSVGEIIPKLVFLIIILIPFLGFNTKFDWVIWAQMISLMCLSIYLVVINRKTISDAFKLKFNKTIVRKMFLYGFPLLLSNFLFWGMRYLDRFYIKFFSNDFELVLYTVALSFAGGFAIISSVFNLLWTPKALLLYKNNNLDSKLLNKISLVINFFGLFFIFVLYLVQGYISVLLPDKYSSIFLLLPLLILPSLFYTAAEVSGIGITLKKVTYKMIYISFLSVAVHFLLSVLLISNFGALGASVSISIAFFVFFLLKTFFSNKAMAYNFEVSPFLIGIINVVFATIIGFKIV